MCVLERLRAELPGDPRARHDGEREAGDACSTRSPRGAAGYLSKRTTGEELRQAVITAYGGGSVITPRARRPPAARVLRQRPRREAPPCARCSATRELEILRLVADGLTDNEIGKQLYISPRTVQNHLTRIREKTGLRRRSELARWAVEHAVY